MCENISKILAILLKYILDAQSKTSKHVNGFVAYCMRFVYILNGCWLAYFIVSASTLRTIPRPVLGRIPRAIMHAAWHNHRPLNNMEYFDWAWPQPEKGEWLTTKQIVLSYWWLHSFPALQQNAMKLPGAVFGSRSGQNHQRGLSSLMKAVSTPGPHIAWMGGRHEGRMQRYLQGLCMGKGKSFASVIFLILNHF
jgi:hypothetical protein